MSGAFCWVRFDSDPIDERQACRQPPTSPSFHSDRSHSRGWVSSSCAKRFTTLHPSVDDEVVILERTAGDGP